MDALLKCGAQQQTNRDGQFPLHVAASAGEEEVCALLIDQGSVPIDSKDAFGFSAVRWATLNGHASTVHSLLAAGADPECVQDGLSLVALASATGSLATVATLIAAGARPDTLALEIAEVMRNEMVHSLLEAAGAQVAGAEAAGGEE